MSTRSIISFKNADNISAIYCHFDGYIDGVGLTLLENYKSESRILELLALGSLSSLNPRLSEDDKQVTEGKITTAYHRDRNEVLRSPDILKDEFDLVQFANNNIAEFIYLFKDGAWFVKKVETKSPFVDLSKLFTQE